jgi:hypothetical protein
MKAITVTDQAAGTTGMRLVERAEPRAAINDVLRTNIGKVSTLDEAVGAFNSTERRKRKTILHVRP